MCLNLELCSIVSLQEELSECSTLFNLHKKLKIF